MLLPEVQVAEIKSQAFFSMYAYRSALERIPQIDWCIWGGQMVFLTPEICISEWEMQAKDWVEDSDLIRIYMKSATAN